MRLLHFFLPSTAFLPTRSRLQIHLLYPHQTSQNLRFSPPYSSALCPFSPALTSSRRASLSCGDEINKCFDDELSRLLVLIPDEMRKRVQDHPELRHLVEIVMDLGRRPLARFPSGDFVLSDRFISVEDICHATAQVGDFAADNRAGISRTLHRISGIRNRKGDIIGLTCRVGRAVAGSANLLRDLVKDGGSLLLIGPPGVGKTTIIREIARILADDLKKRVMIVDTSNEIGGDGDVPHSGIGSARRLQVPNSDMQHKVLIEAVENHMPQVIVIDEIGTKLEALAASTIAQRGIQLVATAHGVTIENLIMNPSLNILVGGVQSVTLGDEEATRRGVKKTVLERKGPSTFTCGAEIISKIEMRVHFSLEETVDALLAGRSPNYEIRTMKEKISADEFLSLERNPLDDNLGDFDGEIIVSNDPVNNKKAFSTFNVEDEVSLLEKSLEAKGGFHLFVYGTNALTQITKAIKALVNEHLKTPGVFNAEDQVTLSEKTDALEEARLAIEHVVIFTGEAVQLLPRSPQVLSAQIKLIEKYKLKWEKICQEPNNSLRILPDHLETGKENPAEEGTSTFDHISSTVDDVSISQYNTDRLPLLPD